MISRIRYVKNGDNGELISNRSFLLNNGKDAVIKVTKENFTIEDVLTHEVYYEGKSNNYQVLLRQAKRKIREMIGVELFNRETRTQKE